MSNWHNKSTDELCKALLSLENIDECYASPKKAEDELGFNAEKSLDDMCRSSYLFQINNKKN